MSNTIWLYAEEKRSEDNVQMRKVLDMLLPRSAAETTCPAQEGKGSMIQRRTPLKRTPMASSTKPIPKRRAKPRRVAPEIGRDEAYKAWLRECHCIACDRVRSQLSAAGFNAANGFKVRPQSLLIVVAHGPVNGRGSKGSDYEAVPLCEYHHAEQHRIGWPRFESDYGFSREREAAALRAVYQIDQENGRAPEC